MSSTLVGVFDRSSQAQAAYSKLAAAGIDKQSMRLSGGEFDSDARLAQDSTEDSEKPGAISRFFSDLFGMNDDAATYTEAVQRGHVVLTVSLADQQRSEEVNDILEDCGAVDVDERVEQWKADGYVPQRSLLPDEGMGRPAQRYAGAERRFNSGAGYAGAERRAGP